MKATLSYEVYKFFPSRCPQCERPFRSPRSFGVWAGKGKSFLSALQRQKTIFKDIFSRSPSDSEIGGHPKNGELLFFVRRRSGKKIRVVSFENRYNMDFIHCRKCGNVTLRIDYGFEAAASKKIARQLVAEKKFTGWRTLKNFGNQPKIAASLAMLARADLALLKGAVSKARSQLRTGRHTTEDSEDIGLLLDPVLDEFINKNRENRIAIHARKRLVRIGSPFWDQLGRECRDSLIAAEILTREIASYSESEPAIDYTPVVLLYSRAIEQELKHSIFEPFKASYHSTSSLRWQTNRDRNVANLWAYAENRRHLTLGEMAHCLKVVGYEMRGRAGNGFWDFLRSHLLDAEEFLGNKDFGSRVASFARLYRNRAAHTDTLSESDGAGARQCTLDPRDGLLVSLAKSVAR